MLKTYLRHPCYKIVFVEAISIVAAVEVNHRLRGGDAKQVRPAEHGDIMHFW